MIAIESNKDLNFFPSYTGKYQWESTWLSTDGWKWAVNWRNWNERCRRNSGETNHKIQAYDELDVLAEALDVDMTVGTLRENIKELFRRGLLFITQKECVDGINGEPGFGMYFTESQD